MKKQNTAKTTRKRLVLNAERIRQLEDQQLKNAAGGGCTSTEPNCEQTTAN